jgi:hypothetical protein
MIYLTEGSLTDTVSKGEGRLIFPLHFQCVFQLNIEVGNVIS